MDAIWRECCVAGADGPCRKPVRNPRVGALGFCNEHDAHGRCCRCGMFWLSLPGPGRVEYDGKTHTAFSCASSRSGGR